MADDLLYHYTGICGLRGLLESKQFWMTSHSYLNDRKEGQDFYDSIYKYIEKGIAKPKFLESKLFDFLVNSKGHSEEEALSMIEYYLLQTACMAMYPDEMRPEAYTISFSKVPDLLSQWRGYCPIEGGFCIGFSGVEDLCKVKDKNGLIDDDHKYLYYNECLYTDEDKNPVISELIDFYLESLSKDVEHKLKGEFDLELMIAYGREFLVKQSIFKNIHFKEESEIRVVTNTLSSYGSPFFRERSNVLIPYYVLDFDPSNLSKIIIGPCADQALAKQGLQRFLGSFRGDFDHVNIECSDIPYRQL